VTLRASFTINRAASVYAPSLGPKDVNAILERDILGEPLVKVVLLFVASPSFASCDMPLLFLSYNSVPFLVCKIVSKALCSQGLELLNCFCDPFSRENWGPPSRAVSDGLSYPKRSVLE
jgi:hypothetical protein